MTEVMESSSALRAAESAEQEVLHALQHWIAEGSRAWLCTIVEISGSSPRPLGSIMACHQRGSVVGSLSGGCVEDDLMERMRAGKLAPELPEICTYGISAEENERLGLPCGGRLRVLVEPYTMDRHGTHISALLRALAERQCIRRDVDIRSGACAEHRVPFVSALKLDESRMQHVLGPRFRLLLIGAGQVAQNLAMLATMLDYRVSVCDPRPHMIADWHGPDIERAAMMPDDFLRAAGVDRFTAIVTLTHDPRIDDMALMEALKMDAFYIGALGSQRTSRTRRERLRELDLDDAEIARLRAPVGLDIGSKRPMEIAIAILAELISLRREVWS
jgi:xanthine dehydrogenase accessory factor